ncbi:thiol-disulfide oxidoreductase DCC family protein [Adhaeribacter radiodurans]|uniref:Thiol-disulfide oxidoreductase DCC family protein n=1 Tax=Adhaeribacter radiodurans TaxID=2745197 RepID=A0A7L7LCW0_9BACT|nr:thiol-disulfide oxidoreductase DCC family protein [Adhaeribacter radiodurans]QMU30682.1 thiol-disulfide oxidoreductase DCC family protein [Adhaeribacter radiodurans]
MPEAAPAIILFDGVCNLCNGFVQFVIRHDPKSYFRFAALQSEVGREILQQVHFPDYAMDTVVLVENNKFYTRSTAALRILRHLSGGWSFAYIAIILPAFIRDLVYVGLAKNRYRWFGKQESCWLPTPELKLRFL